MARKKNYFPEAMNLMALHPSLPKDDMLRWIAQAHPAVFVQAARRTATVKAFAEVAVDREVLALIKSGQMLSAIKRYREIVPGMSLKEAKDYVDGVKAQLFS